MGTKLASWSQSLAVTNYGYYYDSGKSQMNIHTTTGDDTSLGSKYYRRSYNYPLECNQSMGFGEGGNFTIDGNLRRGLSIAIEGNPASSTGLETFLPPDCDGRGMGQRYSGFVLSTSQNGTAKYFGSPEKGTSSGSGRTAQVFSFEGLGGDNSEGAKELYYRNVEALNGTVIRDLERISGRERRSLEKDEDSVGEMLMDDLIFRGRDGPGTT